MGVRKRFCVRGHDTALCGRSANNNCRQCVRERSASVRLTQPSHPRYQWLPFAPLMAFKPIAEHEMDGWFAGLNTYGNTLARAWYRGQQTGRITVFAADEICCHILRRHPAEVYGMAWFEDSA